MTMKEIINLDTANTMGNK